MTLRDSSVKDLDTKAKVDEAMLDLASLAAAGKPLDQRGAARRAGTHEVNVGRALKKLKSSGAWNELVKSAGEIAPSIATTATAQPPSTLGISVVFGSNFV